MKGFSILKTSKKRNNTNLLEYAIAENPDKTLSVETLLKAGELSQVIEKLPQDQIDNLKSSLSIEEVTIESISKAICNKLNKEININDDDKVNNKNGNISNNQITTELIQDKEFQIQFSRICTDILSNFFNEKDFNIETVEVEIRAQLLKYFLGFNDFEPIKKNLWQKMKDKDLDHHFYNYFGVHAFFILLRSLGIDIPDNLTLAEAVTIQVAALIPTFLHAANDMDKKAEKFEKYILTFCPSQVAASSFHLLDKSKIGTAGYFSVIQIFLMLLSSYMLPTLSRNRREDWFDNLGPSDAIKKIMAKLNFEVRPASSDNIRKAMILPKKNMHDFLETWNKLEDILGVNIETNNAFCDIVNGEFNSERKVKKRRTPFSIRKIFTKKR